MVNYIAQRYGTPEAAWAHEQNYGWYAGGGPVVAAINALGVPANVKESMAFGSYLLTDWNAAAADTAHAEYGPWLYPIAKHKGVTQAQAQNAANAAQLVKAAYTAGAKQSPASLWSTNPAGSATRAFQAASSAVGTTYTTPGTGNVTAAWAAVMDALGPGPGTTTSLPSTTAVNQWNPIAQKLHPAWNAANAAWKTLNATKSPKGMSAADWATWVKQKAVIFDRISTAAGYTTPLFDTLPHPQDETPALWSNADSSSRRWIQAGQAATLATKVNGAAFNTMQTDVAAFEALVDQADGIWKQIWGTQSTPLPGGGGSGGGSSGGSSGGGGGVGTIGPGSGPGGSAASTVISLAPLVVGGPTAKAGTGNLGFTIASGGGVPSLGSTAGMFTGGMATGGVVPALAVPGLSANLQKQLTSATSGQLPRTLSDAAGNRVGLHVDQLNITNPVPEKPSDSIARSSNRLAFLAGRGML
jgi:hypothetical protein